MGRTSVKQKAKQMAFKFTKREEILLNIFEDRLYHELKTFVRPLDLENIKTLNACASAFEAHNERLSKLEQPPQPIINVKTTKISRDLIDALKNSKPQPVQVSQPKPMLSPPEQACKDTFNAVKHALRKMNKIQYVVGQTSFIVQVFCQNHWRFISANFYKNDALLSYYRRNDKYVEEKYNKVSMIAADMVAVCMYYVTR